MELSATLPKKNLENFVKEMLKDGEVHKMHAHPEDYKNWHDEEKAADKEKSDRLAQFHKIEDQAELTDEDNSLINFRNVNWFLRTLKENGVKCKVSQERPETCGLWCVVPGKELLGYQFVTSMQVPVMPEWGLLHEEEHGVANGEAAIGWRQVLAQLVLKRVMAEGEIHRIFGHPSATKRTERYRRTLWAARNGKVAYA
jgi:hypothetical protein